MAFLFVRQFHFIGNGTSTGIRLFKVIIFFFLIIFLEDLHAFHSMQILAHFLTNKNLRLFSISFIGMCDIFFQDQSYAQVILLIPCQDFYETFQKKKMPGPKYGQNCSQLMVDFLIGV